MCGRFVITAPPPEIIERFDVDTVEHTYTLNYNVAPTQMIPVIIAGSTVLDRMKWGLIPHWASDVKIGARMINSRVETAAEKPSFKLSFTKKRCIIPATGFYEWKKTKEGKQPKLIHLKHNVFGFAGIWAENKRTGDTIRSCSILTMEPNSFMKKIHHRMPIILQTKHEKDWLDPDIQDVDAIMRLAKPRSPSEFHAYDVSTLVNSPKNNSADNLKKL